MCLVEHIKRVNYQVAIWKWSHIPNPEVPSPVDNNGWELAGDNIQSKWYKGSAFPTKLADILEKEEDSTECDSYSHEEYDSDCESDDEFISDSSDSD